MSSIGPPGARGPTGVAPNAHNGWGQLRWAVNRVAPQSLIRAERYQRHALRVLQQHMRVS